MKRDGHCLDVADEEEKKRIEELGIEVVVTNTVMKSLEDKVELAKTVLAEAEKQASESPAASLEPS